MLPYGVERTGSEISKGFQSMLGTNALERDKRYRIETSLNPDGRNIKTERDSPCTCPPSPDTIQSELNT